MPRHSASTQPAPAPIRPALSIVGAPLSLSTRELPPSGAIAGRDYRTGTTVEWRWRNGRTVAVRSVSGGSSSMPWIAPALFDPQINGFGSVDFQQDDLDSAQLSHAARALALHGASAMLLTLITDDWDRLLHRLRHLQQLRSEDARLARAIAGFHIEGPFLSSEPGFRGAHPPAHMINPSPRRIRQLRQAAGDAPLLLTLASERRGSLASIRAAVRSRIAVSLGHTNASGTSLRAAIHAGATLFTHLGNACPQHLDRHDNILWRVLDGLPLAVSLIPDGVHVSPSLFRLVHRLHPREALIHTTDAMAAAGAPPGRYRLGPMELDVARDGIVRLPGATHFAGSALTPIQGVLRSATMLGCSWRQTWDFSSAIPRNRLGIPDPRKRGSPASFCLIAETAPGRPRSFVTCIPP